MLSIQEIANFCASEYSEDRNPLEDLRQKGFETHFEYRNSQNLFFMRNNLGHELHQLLVVLLDKDEVTVFHNGSEATASLNNN